MAEPIKRSHQLSPEGEKIERTGSGLRESLFDQMERLRDGRVESQDARAFAALANAVIKSVEVQIAYEKIRALNSDLSALPEMEMTKPLQLTNAPDKAA